MYELLTINDQVLIRLLKSNGYVSCKLCEFGNKINPIWSICESCRERHSNDVYRNVTLFNIIRLEIKFKECIKSRCLW